MIDKKHLKKEIPVKNDSPAGENTVQHAAPLQPAVVEPVATPDPFAGTLPSKAELVELRKKAGLARTAEFKEKMPHILRHIASEIRQAAGRGEDKASVDLSQWDEWLLKHKDALLDYLKTAGYGYDTIKGRDSAFVVHIGAD